MFYVKYKNKKGITEITSFVLLTLLIVVVALSTYLFSTNIINKNLAELDNNNMGIYFQKMFQSIDEISSFDGATVGIPVEFKTGQLSFSGNQVYYQSLVKYSGGINCFDNVCFYGNGGYQRTYINLSSGYIFKKNLTIGPGSYYVIFTNLKNESKLSVTFK